MPEHDHDHDHHDDDDDDRARCDVSSPCGPSARLGQPNDRCEVHHQDQASQPAAARSHRGHGYGHEHHHHHHGHGHARDLDRRRLIFALVISGAILLAEVIGGLAAHSLALLSDAGHVLTDMSAQILSLVALLLASRPADARRTYGYYRLEILAAVANGVLLLGLSGFVFYSAWQRIGTPAHVHADIMIPVAIAGLVANVVGAWLLRSAHTLNVRGAYLHILSDLGALLAVLVGAVLMAWKPRLSLIDPILGVLIGVLVVVGAIRLLREATDVLLEAVPSDIDLERVREDVRRLGGVEDVHDLHIWTITSGLHALSAHIVVSKETHIGCNDELLTRVKELLLRRHRIAHSTLQIESTEYEHVGHVH
jgi:cobalt-zinc-cadmium efflux system protein